MYFFSILGNFFLWSWNQLAKTIFGVTFSNRSSHDSTETIFFLILKRAKAIELSLRADSWKCKRVKISLPEIEGTFSLVVLDFCSSVKAEIVFWAKRDIGQKFREKAESHRDAIKSQLLQYIRFNVSFLGVEFLSKDAYTYPNFN